MVTILVGVFSMTSVSCSQNKIKDVIIAEGNIHSSNNDFYVDEKAIGMFYQIMKHKEKIDAYLNHSLLRNRFGTEVGFFYNFRVDENDIIADFEFYDAFMKHKPYEYELIVEMVKKAPNNFGVSMKFYAYHARKNKKGEDELISKDDDISMEHSDSNRVYIRPIDVDSIDWVQFGAITPSGVFKHDD
jgi:hypothetical protein